MGEGCMNIIILLKENEYISSCTDCLNGVDSLTIYAEQKLNTKAIGK